MRTPSSSLCERDARVCWHPYTQHATEAAPLAVASAQGAQLVLEDGRVVIDAISSWWATLHGHGEPRIAHAIAEQAQRLDHVLFAGATHAPAVELAEALLAVAPRSTTDSRRLTRVFYSDDGSTAVEVALKIAYQAAVQRGESERTVFVALEGAYHGDTFGAMSVGDRDPFFRLFEPLLFRTVHVPPDPDRLRQALAELGPRACALILEPLVQGAAGMRMHDEAFVRAARTACDEFAIPLIADEVMTGFGRTGALFACARAGVVPDLLCLAKGLTGGTFPLSATLATEELYESFLADDKRRALLHGHTFTAHPVGCAAALASLALCREREVPARLAAIGERIEAALCSALPRSFATPRRCGGIVAVDLPGESSYFAARAAQLRSRAIELGVLLRPLGNVLYAIPPACTTDEEAQRIGEVMSILAGECRS